MKRTLILLIILSIPLLNYGNTTTHKSYDEKLVCQQLESALNYLSQNTDFKNCKFRIDTFIRDGWGYDSFANQYVAKKLNVQPDNVWMQDKSEVGKIYKNIEGKVYTSGYYLESACYSRKRRPNTLISKLDNKSMLIHITTGRLGKEGASGYNFLFFFDESYKVESFYQSSWIE
ncbi:hypothetical protein WG947_15330 [Pontibacter sp. H259]|uniref:hypothetical protein n=1 Tax=Pontibacter sp. H259 TaxID=3133421 RepID=UPI0030C13079